MDNEDDATDGGDVEDDRAGSHQNRRPLGSPHACDEDRTVAAAEARPRGNQTLLRLLEQAREQRGSPPLWDAVSARLDEEDRRLDVMSPLLRLLDRIRERVDDQTWQLILDFEWRSSQGIVAGVEVGLALGYDHGRAAALVEAQRAPSKAAKALAGRLADLLGDTDAEPHDVLLAFVDALRIAVTMGRREPEVHGVGCFASNA